MILILQHMGQSRNVESIIHGWDRRNGSNGWKYLNRWWYWGNSIEINIRLTTWFTNFEKKNTRIYGCTYAFTASGRSVQVIVHEGNNDECSSYEENDYEWF